MSIPLSQAKALCTNSEFALVKASRTPALASLTASEAKRNAEQSRKLLEKWQDQGRDQARQRSRRVGVGEEATRTASKVRIFQEALQSFEKHLAALDGAGDSTAGSGATAPKSKQSRSLTHRAERAGVRKELRTKKPSLSAKSQVAKKAVPEPAPVGPSSDSPAIVKQPAKKSAAKKPSAKSGGKKQTIAKPAAISGGRQAPLNDLQQLAATTAAKKSRLARSGLTTRLRGHVSARGKRSQGRHDARN